MGWHSIILLVGKSGSGKTTIQNELIKLGIPRVVVHSTRPPRRNEKDDNAYNFVSNRIFGELSDQGYFATVSSYKVNSGETWHYGVSRGNLSGNKVLIASPKCLDTIKTFQYLHPISFYINTNDSIIKRRLLSRGDNSNEVRRRILSDKYDFKNIEQRVDFIFTNNGEIKPVLLAEMILYTYKKRKEVNR